MESNQQTNKQNRDRLTDREQDNSSGSMGGKLGVEGSSEKAKGLMDMDNSTVIVGGGGVRGLNGKGKNTIKTLFINNKIKAIKIHKCLISRMAYVNS